MDARKTSSPTPTIGRTNTVFGSLKWWASSSFGSSNSSTSNHAAKPTNSVNATKTSTSPNHINGRPAAHFGGSSTVSTQKLRESKWFKADESRIFCAVIECGFIVEIKEEGQENDSTFAVVQFKSSKDKKPKPVDVELLTIRFASAEAAATTGRLVRVVRRRLADLWQRGCLVRINNFGDKEKAAHSEKDIRNQIAFALKAKQMLWHNSQHFAYWCRYGERQQDVRRKQMSECLKWGNVGMNAGILLVTNREKATSD